MNAKVDKSSCIGCGLCAGLCPEVFAIEDDGLSGVIAPPTAQTIAAAKDAAGSCPVEAITIEE